MIYKYVCLLTFGMDIAPSFTRFKLVEAALLDRNRASLELARLWRRWRRQRLQRRRWVYVLPTRCCVIAAKYLDLIASDLKVSFHTL